MANNVYIGNRYVPVFANPVEWDSLRTYEALTIVTYLGTSYTSRKAVPAGVQLSNTEYWVVTGNYNAQVEAYRNDVENYKDFVDNFIDNLSYLSADNLGVVDSVSVDQTALLTQIFSDNDNCVIDFKGYTVLLTAQLLIENNIKVVNCNFKFNGDVSYIVKALNCDYVEFENCTFEKLDNSFTEYNRLLRFERCNYACAVNCSFKNYGTAIHALECTYFYADKIVMNEAHGWDDHYGYGIDTSTIHNVIKNVYAENVSNTNGRHALYINGTIVLDALVDNFNVKHWHCMAFALKGANPTSRTKINISNCSFDDAMTSTTSGSGDVSAIIFVPADVSANEDVFIENCVFNNCAFSAIDNSSVTSMVNAKGIVFNASSISTLMERKCVITAKAPLSIDGLTVNGFNSTLLSHVFWLDGATGVYINNVVVDGESFGNFIAGRNGWGYCGLYKTTNPTFVSSSGGTFKVYEFDFMKTKQDSSISNVVLKKFGNVVTMNINTGISFSTSDSSSSPTFTIPEGYRPTGSMQFLNAVDNVRFIVESTGVVYPISVTQATVMRGTWTWIV